MVVKNGDEYHGRKVKKHQLNTSKYKAIRDRSNKMHL